MTFGDGSKKQGAFVLASKGLTPGKLRGLQRISNPDGTLTMLALDQNNSVVDMAGKALRRAGEDRGATYEEVVEAKLDLMRGLATAASAVLIDPYYGAWSAVASGTIPPHVGLLLRLERTKYEMSKKGAPLATIEPGWGVEKAKRMGADGIKFLAQFEPTEPESADANFALVERVYEECKRHDLLLLLEAVAFPLDGETKQDASFLDRKAETVIETARMLSRYCDVYKAEFPGTLDRESDQQLEDNLQALDAVAERPWVLLSAGVDYDQYLEQVEMALRAGASGVLGGRAFWKEYFQQADAPARASFLTDVARRRLVDVDAQVRAHGSPWFARYGFTREDLNAVRAIEGWHFRYPGA
ncbi:tagatose 1,6-diphosphate aldolase [Paludisphaera mucosa]|uniref:Tagatose 1,6-diphosphate aldolase n=1 Tax=Paludisphaera mucosa TaxID=3030827 RepID=A0ABT6FII3_9BACT|nr:tagatose 1,6-diphosphate aldolase [Paludisphaera mucosa]MDG3007396.1 tagatose 1,6-diphosphate aldolase [Paludisphaera mucosa]